MDTVVWAALAVAGLLAGIGIGFWLGRLDNKEDRVAELESELDTYKAQVTEHFAKSATHFQAIGQQYKALYDHMAAGSQSLCADSSGTVSFPAPGDVAALAEPKIGETPVAEVDAADSEVIESRAENAEEVNDDAGTIETEETPDDDNVTVEVIAESGDDTAVDELGASESTDDVAAESEVSADAIPDTDDEPDKRLYH
ncbi:MAG: DUF1043 family protein [Pseudomonadota bacterium]